ncbi:MAG: ABC transporter permease [Oscillatoriales cyanobacterium SM2_2_1]|nr:ABC transporter permease [Oscillatoriales cyanobacterium SM2_2_1]
MDVSREVFAVCVRLLLELLRSQRTLLLWMVFPSSMLLLNGLILSEAGSLPSARAFAIATPATLVGSALFFSCFGGTVSSLVTEREQQTIRRLLLSPLSGVSYFLGILLAYGCIGLGQTALIYAMASFWGVRYEGDLLAGLAVIFLSISAYVASGFFVGTRFARCAEDVNALVASVGVPMLLLGGAFFPPEYLPQGLRRLAEVNPIFHMNEAMASLSRVRPLSTDWQLGQHLIFVLSFVVVSLGAGCFSYRQLLRAERRL